MDVPRHRRRIPVAKRLTYRETIARGGVGGIEASAAKVLLADDKGHVAPLDAIPSLHEPLPARIQALARPISSRMRHSARAKMHARRARSSPVEIDGVEPFEDPLEGGSGRSGTRTSPAVEILGLERRRLIGMQEGVVGVAPGSTLATRPAVFERVHRSPRAALSANGGGGGTRMQPRPLGGWADQLESRRQVLTDL